MGERETEFTTKQEMSTSINDSAKIFDASTTSWSKLKDPRIVRVSRAFGGKDRHSKVCTVRGLIRDRRVRLSVPTAIQLYDLQERLGLNQPSKVVDWLLNAAKNEIDELPPLQFPQGSFTQSQHPIFSQDKQGGLKIIDRDQENWARTIEEQNEGSFMRWDPSNITLSHDPPRSYEFTNQPEDWQSRLSLAPLPSTLSFPSGSHQVIVYPQMAPMDSEFDPRKQVHFHSSQLPNSSSQPIRPFHFSMTANLLPSLNSTVGIEQNQEF
ncbi:hypothetical protein ACJIZ3_014740 [Penstemon smallii]|uniref:TCP domain-containing protein n=1 Tax=Penstemon smallii TaxID=265156 RepID=A0ABD3RMQ6_9LAMI